MMKKKRKKMEWRNLNESSLKKKKKKKVVLKLHLNLNLSVKSCETSSQVCNQYHMNRDDNETQQHQDGIYGDAFCMVQFGNISTHTLGK